MGLLEATLPGFRDVLHDPESHATQCGPNPGAVVISLKHTSLKSWSSSLPLPAKLLQGSHNMQLL